HHKKAPPPPPTPPPAPPAAAPAAAAAAADSSASAAAAAAAAASSKFFPKSRRSGVFLVEDVERRQADVGDFFLTECDLGRGRGPRRHIRRRHGGRCGRAPPQRPRYADDSHDPDRLLATLSF